MFYPLAMMLVSLLLALGWFPKVGMLRQAYHRVASGGAAFEPGEKGEKLVDIDEVDEHNVSSERCCPAGGAGGRHGAV